jgi:hypothetical protein
MWTSTVAKLGFFSADQASTIEVAILVEGIKGEVIAIPANFGPCLSIQQQMKMVVADPIEGGSELKNTAELKDTVSFSSFHAERTLVPS